MDVAIFSWQIHRLHPDTVAFHVAHVAPQGYTIGKNYIVFHGDSLCIAKVEPHLMANMNILAHLAAQGTPDGGTQMVLVGKLKDILANQAVCFC